MCVIFWNDWDYKREEIVRTKMFTLEVTLMIIKQEIFVLIGFFQDHLYNYSSQGVKAKRGLVTIDNNVIVIVWTLNWDMCNINSLKFSSSKDQGRLISPQSNYRISALPLASSTPPFSSVSPVSRTNFTLSPAEKPLGSLSAAHRLRLVRLPDGDWHRAWSRRAGRTPSWRHTASLASLARELHGHARRLQLLHTRSSAAACTGHTLLARTLNKSTQDQCNEGWSWTGRWQDVSVERGSKAVQFAEVLQRSSSACIHETGSDSSCNVF